MIPYDIENPDVQRFIERYYQEVMSKIAGHPALNSIWLANEPSYLNYGNRSMALFRLQMQEKYGSVEKLNESWGTSLKSFADITPANFGRAITPAQTDFWWFNMGRINHHFEWMISNIRKYDKDVPVTFKLNSLQMGHHDSTLNVGGWLAAYPNVDQEGVTDMSQIAGMDGGTFPFIKQYYDWLRSLNPEKPVVNLEFKYGGRRMKLDMWKGVLHGLAGIDGWCWHPKPSFANAMSSTESMYEQPLQTYNIQRLINEVMAFQKFPRSPFAVLYPDPVQPRSWYYFDAHNPTVHALKLMGYAVDYVTEKRLAEGRLEKYSYRILLLPAADYIKDETLKRVEAFVRAGGIAIVVGSLPEHDEMGRSRDVGWLKAPADAKPATADIPGTVVYSCGKGKVWIVPSPRPQADEAAFYRKFVPNDQERNRNIYASLKEIAKQELPPLPIVLNGLKPECDDTELRTINWKDSSGRDCLLTYIFNERDYSGHESVTLAPQFNVKVSEGVDLITGEKIDPAKIEIPGWGVRLIKWTLAGK